MANVDKERAERKSILRKHWGFLKANFILKYISDALIQDGVISPADWMNLKQKHTINNEMNEDFLFTLYNEKLDSFPKFVKALRVNGFENVADVLEGRAEPEKFHNEDMNDKSTKESKKQNVEESVSLTSLDKTIREEGNLTRKGVKGLKSDVDNVKFHVKSLQSDIEVVSTDVRGVKSDMDGVKSDVNSMKTEVRAEVKAELKGVQSEMDRQMKIMMKDYKKQLEQMMKEENEKQVENIAAAIRDKQHASERTMAKMKLEITKMESQKKELEDKKVQLEQELKDIRTQLTEVNKRKVETRNETHVRKIIDDLEMTLDKRELEIEILKKSLLKLKTEKSKLRSELDTTKADNHRLGDIIGMLRAELLHKNRHVHRESQNDAEDFPEPQPSPVMDNPRRPAFTKSPRQLVPVAASPRSIVPISQRFPTKNISNAGQSSNPKIKTTSTLKK